MKHPVDVHVGKRVRQRRWMLGMTQQQLAEQVGIKFQQIQKYETGMNRVSASRLWDIAEALDVPVSFFFEGLDGETAAPCAVGDARISRCDREALELVRSYYAIPEIQRRRLFELRAVAVGHLIPAPRRHREALLPRPGFPLTGPGGAPSPKPHGTGGRCRTFFGSSHRTRDHGACARGCRRARDAAPFPRPRPAADNKAAGGFDPVTEARPRRGTGHAAVLAARRPEDAVSSARNSAGRQGRAGSPGCSTRSTARAPSSPARRPGACWSPLSDADGPDTRHHRPALYRRALRRRPRRGAALIRAGLAAGRFAAAPRDRCGEAILFTTFPEVGTPGRGRGLRAGGGPGAADPLRARLLRLRAAGAGADRPGDRGGAEPYDIHGPMAVIRGGGRDRHRLARRAGAADGGQVLAAANAGDPCGGAGSACGG